SFVINELDTEFDDWSENPLLSRVVDVADVIIGKRDLMARTGRQSFAILINRNDAPQVARFGASLYQQISEELSGKKQDEIRWGIGYVRVMQDTGGAYACLRQSEMAAIQALEGKHPGCLLFEENAQTKQQSQTAQIDIYQSAERFGFGEVFNRILCRYAIHRIGELQLEGRHDKVSVHLLSSAIEDKSLLDFIQTELRRLQVVGTEMLLEFDLPGLAKNLKVARTFLGEISALGIGVTLGNFACNDTAFKVLAYLNARVVRPHPSLMRTDYDRISKIANQLKAMGVQIILPGMSQSGQISLHWSEVADYVQAEYLD
ncbi:MAG: EAL domain-containing protein, partial [Candidatus Thiodiazotropha sp.]